MAHEDERDPADPQDPGDERTQLSGPPHAPGEDEATISARSVPRSRPDTENLENRPGWIGGYEILSKLGEGGMGVVYEAQQQDPRRIVALKVIRGGAFVDEARVKMFEREVETLARLSHPNIGSIYSSGRTEDGRHYFAMELVRGTTLDEYLAKRPAPDTVGELEHRLRLFQSIVSTVHYAHQRGVIHRDLKPSNIIVSEESESGTSDSSSHSSSHGLPTVKILDFGLARITDEDVVAASMATEIGVIKGTLPYMSPEQARGDAAAIDVRTDVYALGVVLFEIVSGQKPYDVAQASLLEAVRVICKEPPRSLSGVWDGKRRLDQDVETIAGKALEKEPERRYDSAAALAEDVSRFLNSQPILARPPSALYQVRKFAQRHRPIVVGAALAVAALLLGVVASTTLYLRAEQSAEEARIEAATAEQISAFLRSMLEGVGPSVAQGRDTTLLYDILKQAEGRIDEELAEEPILAAHIRSTLGVAYYELNDFENADAQFSRALEDYRAEYGEKHRDVAQSYFNLGLLESKKQNHDQALANIQRAIELSRAVHGDPHEMTAQFTTHLGNTLVNLGRYEEALPYLTSSLENLRGLHGDDHVDVGIALNSLGNAYHHLSRYDEAGALYEEALDIHRRLLGDRHPYVITDLGNLAYLHKNKGDLDESERRFREVLALKEEIHPDGDPSTLHVIAGLGTVLQYAGRYEESESVRLQGLHMAKSLYGERSEDVARQINGLGAFFDSTGQPRRALEFYEEGLAMAREAVGVKHPLYATSLNNVGLARSDLGDVRGSLEALVQARALAEELYGPEAPDTTLTLINLGRTYRDGEQYERAEEVLREAIEIRLRVNGREHFGTGTPMVILGRLLAERGSHDEAVQLTKEGADIFEKGLGPDHFQSVRTRMIHADALIKADRAGEAEAILRPLYARQIELEGSESDRALRVGAVLGQALFPLGRIEEAEALYAAAFAAPEGTFDMNEATGIRISYARSIRTLGRLEEAREILEDAHASYLEVSGPRAPNARRAARELAELYEAWAQQAPGEGHEAQARSWREQARPR